MPALPSQEVKDGEEEEEGEEARFHTAGVENADGDAASPPGLMTSRGGDRLSPAGDGSPHRHRGPLPRWRSWKSFGGRSPSAGKKKGHLARCLPRQRAL